MVMGIADRAGTGATGFEFMVATESDLPTGISPLGRVGVPVGISESLRNLPFSSFVTLSLGLPVGILDCEASAFFPDVRFAFDKVLSL
jgi:hypothetical protein